MPVFESLYTSLIKNLHFIYLLFAVPLVYFSITEIPPFQNPDEPSHFARAEQVSRFVIVPKFIFDKTPVTGIDTALLSPDLILPSRGGFAVDKGVYELSSIYKSMFHHYGEKTNKAKPDSAKNIKWKTGISYTNFANTAIYPPFVYTMPALGINIGKLANLSILKTFYISRALNGLMALTLSFITLIFAKRSKLLLFTVLLFPMTISMFSSISQDAVLISCAFLFIGIIDNVESSAVNNYTKWHIWLLVILITIIGVGKAPYILFSFIFLFLKVDKKTKVIGIVIPFVLLLLWLFASSANLSLKYTDAELDFNSKLQVAHVLSHPIKFIGLFFNFDGPAIENFFKMFVGVLGWLDLTFPIDYYHAAYVIAFLAFISIFKFNIHDSIKLRIALFCVAAATILAVLTAQYITWTPLDATYLGGMQGRYIIPVFPFLALAASLSIKEDTISKMRQYILIPILLFPILTALVLADGIINRYYLR